MTDVKSKNLYELLGNDHDQDSDKEPEPPTKTVDKTAPRTGKRDGADTQKPDAAPQRTFERRGGGFSKDNENFRDRTNARNNPNRDPNRNANRDAPVETGDGTVRGRDSGPGTQRGGRGRGGPRRGGDRAVNRTGRNDHEKQVAHGWGAETGEAEQADENAGEALAQEDKKEAIAEETVAEPEQEPEPEDTNVSYAQYLEQQAAKKLEGLGLKEARSANEGAKEDKKWKNATAFNKNEVTEESYFEGQAKAKRERERASKKQVVDIDYSFKEPPRESSGRGRGDRGGRGRGEGRGGRGRGEGRGRGGRGEGGEYRPRGDGEYRPRGDRTDRGDRGDRGGFRGGRGRSDNQSVPVSDDTAFPALGGK